MCTERKQISNKLRLQVFFVLCWILGGFATRLNFVLGEKKKLAMDGKFHRLDTPHMMIHRSAVSGDTKSPVVNSPASVPAASCTTMTMTMWLGRIFRGNESSKATWQARRLNIVVPPTNSLTHGILLGERTGHVLSRNNSVYARGYYAPPYQDIVV